ncbi:DNA (cytosine-5-)-methyltransferase N-terminal subunit [[Mycoplasma] collis]|uniref:DNA (cytosine-5-)-methyltransferase N-terminal subunit n=1 Tax=[Mycoplasma] collis TaxID=2127 RepID=UPI00051AC933|nr:hypothetical protein [[Mycoplasma] collis]
MNKNKKNIKIFEAFSSIGSQYQALKNISSKLNINIISTGFIEWYVDAIISYEIIHNKVHDPELEFTRNKMIEILNNFNFSIDSKNEVSKNYFARIKEDKLRNIFPYLKNFYYKNNNTNKKDNMKKMKIKNIRQREERERERDDFAILKM